MQKIIVNEKYDGKKLSKFLLDSYNGLSIDTFYKALRKKDIRINDIRVNKDTIIHQNDEIKIYIIDEFLYKSFVPDIIFEDNNIIVVNKPCRN